MPHRSFLRAHAVLIVFITLLTVGGAAVAVTSQQPKYEATASVLVRSERLPKGGVQAPDMVTEKQIALSGSVARRAADLLSSPSGYLGAGLSVDVPVDSDVLEISYTASTRHSAYIGASVYTRAYVEYRNEIAAEAAARSNIPPVTEIITPATRPTDPVSVPYPLIIGLSFVIGLGLAFATAMARDWMTGKVRDAEHVQNLVGHPVLGRISARARMRRPDDSVLPVATSPGAEVYGQVAARFLREAQHRTATLVVTSAIAGPGKSAVAVNIAAALANAGRETVLVRSNATPAEAADRTRGNDGVDTTNGRLETAVPQMLRTEVPRLSVAAVELDQLGTGEAVNGNITAVLELKRSLLQLERTGRLIVVEAEPLLGHQLTPLIAASAEATILVVDPHRETSRDLAGAGSVLAHADRIMGCVLYDSRTSMWGRLTRRGHGTGSQPEIEPKSARDETARAPNPSANDAVT